MAVPNWCRAIAIVFLILGLIALGIFKVLFEILLHPLTAFKKTPRNVPPKCLLDSSLGTHEYITANGLKFHCVTAGDKANPLMLFLHGFPEFWFSWRYQLREFSKDYRVVAIDMRGYGETDRPPKKLDYVKKNLVRDISELVSALGYTSCILVGHDWGGAVAWSVALTHPQILDKLVIMNATHPRVIEKHFFEHFSQVVKSWYVFMFQFPWLPELAFSLRDYRLIEDAYVGKNGLVNPASVSPEVIEAYKYVFAQPGALTGPINYYRCATAEKTDHAKQIEAPTLVIWGDKDAFLEAEMADQHCSIGTNVTVRLVLQYCVVCSAVWL